MATHKSILQKTIHVGSSTLLSRVLGIAREMLQVRYLGLGIESDAFITAFKIPNSLRKIFAEGALSAAFIPTMVHTVKHESRQQANRLMTGSFLLFEGALAILCFLIFLFPHAVLKAIAYGFDESVIASAVPYLRVLISLILCISSSALLAGALQSVHHFLISALAPAILNMFYITGLLLGMWYNLPVMYLCYFILAGSLFNFILHLIVYFRYGFGFAMPNQETKEQLKHLFTKFLPFLLSMSVMEINFFIDTSLASFLAVGSVSLINYGGRLMGIPLGVFATAFSSILLPHFARVSLYAPKRLNFYLFEAMKLIIWVTIPATLLLAYFSPDIFITLFVSKKFPMSAVPEACAILSAFLVGLCAFSLNKVLLNIYYSLHDTQIPTLVSVAATAVNLAGNLILMQFLGAAGLALATSISGIVQTLILLYYLRERYHFNLYGAHLWRFILRYGMQLAAVVPLFIATHWLTKKVLAQLLAQIMIPGMSVFHVTSAELVLFFMQGLGFWFWTGPLVLVFIVLLFMTRQWAGYRLFFVE